MLKRRKPQGLQQDPHQNRSAPSAGRWWVGWLIGTVCVAFSQGHYPNPVLAVAGIAFWIWFFRQANLWLAAGLLVAGNMVAWEIAYRGMVPMPLAARLGLEFGVSLLFSLVFCLDRAALRRCAGKWPAWLVTLVFPAGWAAFEFATARLSPGATWGSIAYSFIDKLPLVHVAALFGWTAVTFLTGWFAGLLATMLEPAITPAAKRSVALLGMGVLILASIFGSLRSHAGHTEIPVSLLVAPSTFHADEHFNELWSYTRGIEISAEDREQARSQIQTSKRQHFDLVRNEAAADSKLILWAEANATITAEEEPEWIAEATEIARAHEAYIGISLFVFYTDGELVSRNKFLLFAPDGELIANFEKRTRPPGVDHEVGEGPLPLIETEFGKWTTAICYDMDFPQIVQPTAGKVDLILAPSNDWPAAADTHQRMARMRAIENGCCLIRPTKDGVSCLADSTGSTVAMQVTYQSPASVLRSRIHLGRSWSLYALIGDAFSWLCIAACLALVGILVLSNKNP